MEEFVLFLLTFLFIFLLYQILFVVPYKKSMNKKEKVKRELLEITYLKSRYSLDFDKLSYNQLLQLCAITSSLDMAIAVTVVSFIDSFLWEIIVGFVVIVLLIFISYHLIYLFYKKKGMVKNGKHK